MTVRPQRVSPEWLRAHAAALVQPGPQPAAEATTPVPCSACACAAGRFPLDQLAHLDCARAIAATGNQQTVEEEWPAQHVQLVEHLCAVRPGLRPEQAHAALQGLRTLRWTLHPDHLTCEPVTTTPATAPLAACTATETGLDEQPLACVLAVHDDTPWHYNGRDLRWRSEGSGLSLKRGSTP
jgi:hypothetical protein